MSTQTIDDRKVYVPEAFGKTPENVGEALLAAAALLEEEGRWRKGDWYEHDNTEMPEVKDDPYCNGWGACADGALKIVVGGLRPETGYNGEAVWTLACDYFHRDERDNDWLSPQELEEFDTPENRLYSEARDCLQDVVNDKLDSTTIGVEMFNDSGLTSREDVVACMRKAADEWARNSSPSEAVPTRV